MQEFDGREEKRNEFIMLRAKGYSYAKIAKKLHVAKSTLANWNGELENEIASMRAIELEQLMDQFYLLKEGRIRFLGQKLKQMEKEITRRTLTEVSTERLMELVLKYWMELKKECVEPVPLTYRSLSSEDEIGPKLNDQTQSITKELKNLLQRFRTGLVTPERLAKEISVLLALMKAQEIEVLDKKLDKIKSLLMEKKS